jgi:uncharacterized membrane protein
MRNVVLTYLSVLVVFVGVDALWIGAIAGNLYRREMGTLMADRPLWSAAFLFYLLYAAGITVLAIPDGQVGWPRALLQGAVLGLCAYATYNLTNVAVVRGWPIRLSVMDLAWGTALTAFAAVMGYLVKSRLG